jgi:hypothetical protein
MNFSMYPINTDFVQIQNEKPSVISVQSSSPIFNQI